MKHSPLYQRHLDRKAKMADFGGWLMPIDYPGTGVLIEHTAVREKVGLFDVSHLGKVSVKGTGALAFLNIALTNDLTRMVDGQAQYTMMCNEAGGVIDDLIAYRNNVEDFFLVPNASNTTDVVATLARSAPAGIEIQNLHESFGVIAIQGPKAEATLNKLGVKTDLAYMSFSRATIAGASVILCRTGYTGEFGFEILPDWKETEHVWDALVTGIAEFGGAVCGLGARDTLRTEMGYPLHGHELSLDITPVQANASWAVGWQKSDFTGAAALRKERSEGATRTLRGLKCIGRGIPRGGMDVRSRSGATVGNVTSGTFSPTLKIGIALAFISTKLEIGEELVIDIRGRDCDVEIVKLPFVSSHVR
jgi:aminomethyltransferase